jgi:DNA-binding transcriptional ArsR family regulator
VSAHEPRLARVAAMIADPARSRILAYLLDGHVASAGELARAAGVQPSTASAHLDKLAGTGLVACEPRGRHRWFRLADADVAHALQALALVAERGTHERVWAHPERARLRDARCCYGHLAGRVGVALWAQLQREGRLAETSDGVALTPAGERWLAELGFVPAPVRPGQRLAYGCLDWSERRDHMAGSLARQLLDHFVAAGWLRRRAPGGARPGGHRVLDVTVSGRRELLPRLGVDLIGDG